LGTQTQYGPDALSYILYEPSAYGTVDDAVLYVPFGETDARVPGSDAHPLNTDAASGTTSAKESFEEM